MPHCDKTIISFGTNDYRTARQLNYDFLWLGIYPNLSWRLNVVELIICQYPECGTGYILYFGKRGSKNQNKTWIGFILYSVVLFILHLSSHRYESHHTGHHISNYRNFTHFSMWILQEVGYCALTSICELFWLKTNNLSHSGKTDEANCSWLHPVWPPPKRPDHDNTFCVVSRASTELKFSMYITQRFWC